MTQTSANWLVGSDGSIGSDRAIEWAVGFAPGRADDVHILRAWQYPAFAVAESGMLPETADAPTLAHHDLERIADSLATKGICLTSTVEDGRTVERLLEACARSDLLIVGSRGRGGFTRLLLGSVSSQCATHARIPVAVIPDGARTDGGLRRVLVGVDRSPASAAAVEWALEFTPGDVPITVAGIWKPSWWAGGGARSLGEQHKADMHVDFEDFVARIVERSDSAHTIESIFDEGHPAERLVELARDADLVVLGERGHRGLRSAVLGSVTTEVLHDAPCATVVVPVPASRGL